MCQAKSEGLVRYPTTVTVPTQCADNAHSSNSTSSHVPPVAAGLGTFCVTVMRDTTLLLSQKKRRFVEV